MTPDERARALERCDREIAEITARDPNAPGDRAFLATMGRFDWEAEKRAIDADAERQIFSHFSCGAASAVATKLALADHGPSRVTILNAFVAEEDPDNRRFADACARWFGHPITVLRDSKYGASVREVWRRKRFMNSALGAPCSSVLKHQLLEEFPGSLEGYHVLGYTADEAARAERFAKVRPTMRLLTPLIDRNLTHADCLAMVERAGIELPRMYRLGYRNANCIGCCKGGEGYWNKIRRDFPDVFVEVRDIQESIGVNSYFFRNRQTGERIGLAQLAPGAGRYDSEPEISCSFFCDMAEKDVEEAEKRAIEGEAAQE